METARVRNIDWEQLRLEDWLEVGGTLLLVVRDESRRGVAVADPLFGWYVRHFSRLDHPLEEWASAANGGRVFMGRAPQGAERAEMRGPRFHARCTVRPSGLWGIHVPRRRHVREIAFFGADERIVHTIPFADVLPDRSGRFFNWLKATIQRTTGRRSGPIHPSAAR